MDDPHLLDKGALATLACPCNVDNSSLLDNVPWVSQMTKWDRVLKLMSPKGLLRGASLEEGMPPMGVTWQN
jgi:hypothetical protein